MRMWCNNAWNKVSVLVGVFGIYGFWGVEGLRGLRVWWVLDDVFLWGGGWWFEEVWM